MGDFELSFTIERFDDSDAVLPANSLSAEESAKHVNARFSEAKVLRSVLAGSEHMSDIQWSAFLREQFVQSSSIDGDELDQHLGMIANFPNDVWRFPVVFMLRMKKSKIALLFLLLLSSVFLVRTAMPESPPWKGQAFKIIPHLADRFEGVLSMDRLEHLYAKTECGEVESESWDIGNSSIIFNFEQNSTLLGWGWHSTGSIEEKVLLDTTRWSLQVYQGTEWIDLQPLCVTRKKSEVSDVGSRTEFFTGAQSSQTRRVGTVLAFITLLIGSWSSLYLCRRGHNLFAKRVLCAKFYILALICLITGSMLSAEDFSGAVTFFKAATPLVLVALSLSASSLERYSGWFWAVAGLTGILSEAVLVASGLCGYESFVQAMHRAHTYLSLLVLSAGIYMIVLRQSHYAAVLQHLKLYSTQLDGVWAKVSLAWEDLEQLQSTCALRAGGKSFSEQYYNDAVPLSEAADEEETWVQCLDLEWNAKPVRSLDQLYTQAAACQLLLRDKVTLT